MEQRERDESSSKLEEALRELTGAETTGKIEEYENEREGADVDSETACTDMRRAERMPAWRQEEDARKSKLSESRVDVVNELNDDDWEQEELDELDEWDESEKSPRGMGRLAAVFRPSDDLLAAFFLFLLISLSCCKIRRRYLPASIFNPCGNSWLHSYDNRNCHWT